MIVKSFVFNAFYENTYVIYDTSGNAYIIDPGCYEKYEQQELTEFIEGEKLKPIAIVNTHCHVDHVLGNAFLKDYYKIPLWIPEKEQDLLRAVEVYAPQYGLTRYHAAIPDRTISEKDTLMLGDEILEIRFAPGHAPGHLIFYHPKSKVLIAGDVIFRESIGRTDLPGGSFTQLEASIRAQVYSLPDDVTIYPGHGPETNVKYEKTNNPFVKF